MTPEQIKMQKDMDALATRVASLENLLRGSNISIDMDVKQRSDLAALVQQRFGIYVGYVLSSGNANFLPKGWSSVRDSTGQYTVTHNLGTTAYVVNVNVTGSTSTRACNSVVNTNVFQVNIGDATNSTGENNAFIFLLTKV